MVYEIGSPADLSGEIGGSHALYDGRIPLQTGHIARDAVEYALSLFLCFAIARRANIFTAPNSMCTLFELCSDRISMSDTVPIAAKASCCTEIGRSYPRTRFS
jgi:hypothetical protein